MSTAALDETVTMAAAVPGAETEEEGRPGTGGGRLRVVLALLLAAGVLGSAAWLLRDLYYRPISSVRVAGDLRHVSRAALERAVARYAATGFFRVDVDAIRAAAMRLPWVKTVSVRRAWPDSLHIAVIEREPAARWATGGLVDDGGTLFSPGGGTESFSGLPLLEGPRGTEHGMLERYRSFERALAPMHAHIRVLQLNRRGAWRAELDDGIRLVLGRGPGPGAGDQRLPERLRVFARAFRAALADKADTIEQVDLRYPNGFAVRWKTGADDAAKG